MNRFANALYINAGACNPSGITRALEEAYDEIRADPHYKGTVALTGDPAVRLIIHQLAYICGMNDGSASDNYNEAVKACVEKADVLPDGTVRQPAELEVPKYMTSVGWEHEERPAPSPGVVDRGVPYVDVALEEGTRYERAFGDGNDVGG